ncbi:hypothetical protein [Streptosporangium saharense]|uniref:hypothetical protein n=1 Tax=Streptosporangium saharense TaxID=1706840 RepID=UPI00341B2CDF
MTRPAFVALGVGGGHRVCRTGLGSPRGGRGDQRGQLTATIVREVPEEETNRWPYA